MAFLSSLRHNNTNAMKIIIEDDGGFQYARNFPERPDSEEALFTACYLLTKIYSAHDVRTGMVEVMNDL